jgi:HSP20 family protein
MHGMRSRIQAVVLPSEIGELAEEARRIFAELDRTVDAARLTGQCSPAIDVYETEGALEISVELPGVDAEAVRIIVKESTVLIVGEKVPRRGRGDANFHLVERGFGLFARTVSLATPCNAAAAAATLIAGELRITLPKIGDRRGRVLRVPIATDRPDT